MLNHKITSSNYYNKKCKCGCGKYIKKSFCHKYRDIPDYISGHNLQVWSKESRDAVRHSVGLVWKNRSKQEKKKIFNKIAETKTIYKPINCEICDKIIKRPLYKNRRFCSHKCRGIYIKGMSYEQLYGKEKAKKMRKDRSKSMTELMKGREFKPMKKIKRKCPICNNIYKTYKRYSKKTCGSKECRYKFIANYFKGKSFEQRYDIKTANYIREKQGKFIKNKTYEQAYGKEKAKEMKKKQLEKKLRKDITKDRVLKTVEDIINKYGKNIKKTTIKNILKEKLSCSFTPIERVCGNLDSILNTLKINIPFNKSWKEKENFGLDLCKEIYGEGYIKKYYKDFGYPDYVPFDESKPIIDIKSTLSDCSIEQQNKYDRIRNGMRFMVFDENGKTNINEERIILIKEVIKSLPNNKRMILQKRYEHIIKKDRGIIEKCQILRLG